MRWFGVHLECGPCNNACCHSENIYADSDELLKLGVVEITNLDDGRCRFLRDGFCSVFDSRPLECRLFPFDIKLIAGKTTWIIWDCLATPRIDVDKFLDHFEYDLLPKHGPHYVKCYLSHHDFNEPPQYRYMNHRILREIKWHAPL